jgi:hypothetical protein
MCDLVAESKAYQQALQRKMITHEMYQDSVKLSKALCQLCLQNQIDTYNRLINELQKSKPVPVAVPPEQPVEEDKEMATNE